MSTTPYTAKRHALNLPAGSVRAIHVLCIVGLVCAIILIPGSHTIPPYLIYLLFLMVGHYFASHGVTIATRDEEAPSPLYLPGGTIRILILAALIGSVGWKLHSDQEGLVKQFESSLELLKLQPYLPLVIMGGFFLGVMVRAVLGRLGTNAFIQDFEGWISLVAMIGIVLAGIIHLIVNTSLADTLYLPTWEGFVGGVVAFYFGERS
jgi:hypothetical protein